MYHEPETFLDHVHGQILLHPLCVQIVDTPEFQRLRDLKTVGPVCYVFPGGSHNRFEHCVGVSHLAGVLVKHLKQNQPELNITDEDVLCVQIAGLVHDLGHGPFSHMFDAAFLPRVRPEVCKGEDAYCHEYMSVDLLTLLLDRNKIDVSEYNLTNLDVEFIKECVLGSELRGGLKMRKGRTREKSFLYDIVSNAHSGLDVDKLDYFARDAKKTGLKSGCDFGRVLTEGRVMYVSEEVQQGVFEQVPRIAFPDKLVGDLLAAFQTRYQLHNTVYQHKVVKSIEFMIVDAMVEAEKAGLFRFVAPDGDGKERTFTLAETIDSPAAFCFTNDHILDTIRQSTDKDPHAVKARNLLHRVETRDLYESVGEANIPTIAPGFQSTLNRPEDPTSKRRRTSDTSTTMEELFNKGNDFIVDELLNSPAGRGQGFSQSLKPDDIIVERMKVHHGFKEKNPCRRIYFFSKSSRQRARHLPEENYSALCPRTFMKRAIRVFTRRRADEQVKQVYTAFAQILSKFGGAEMASLPFLHPASTSSPVARSEPDGQPNPWASAVAGPDASGGRKRVFRSKTFRDQIHGQITLPPLLVAVMDTPQFQRLRSLKQLGCSSFVFPGASHSRFEHSVGVAYLSGELVKHLAVTRSRMQLPEAAKVNERDVICVQLVGLLHDLGHGPFSHVFEGTFLRQSRPARTDYCHEKMSVELIDILLKENNIDLAAFGLHPEEDLAFVKECILGNELPGGIKSRRGRPLEKGYLYDVVSNVHSGLDTDKLDYYERDARNTGVRSGCDIHSLVVECRVGLVADRPGRETRTTPHLVFPDKLINEVLGAFQTRYRLHNRVYQNKVVKAVELMLVDAMLSADRAGLLKFPSTSAGGTQMVRLSQVIDHPKAFLLTNDSVLHMIRVSSCAAGAEARAIIRRLDGRDLYKSVGELAIRNFSTGNETKVQDTTDAEPASEDDEDVQFVTTSKSPKRRATQKRSVGASIIDFAEPLDDLGLSFQKKQLTAPGTPGSTGQDGLSQMGTQTTVGDEELSLRYQGSTQELAQGRTPRRISSKAVQECVSTLYNMPEMEIVKRILSTDVARNINRNYESELNASHFLVEKMKVHHGMGSQNPCNNMFFFSKAKPDHPRHLKEYRYDTLCPKTFEKKAFRVFSRSTDPKRMKQVHNAFLETLERLGCEHHGFAPSSSAIESPIAYMSPTASLSETEENEDDGDVVTLS